MAVIRQITCTCGFQFRGKTDDELWAKAQLHIETAHPDMVGKVARADILAQAETI